MSKMKAVSLALVALWLSAVAVGHAQAAQTVSFDISEQPLGDALRKLGEQAGLQVVVYSEVSKGRMAPRVEGQLTVDGALDRLLANSGLKYEHLNARTVAVLPEGTEKIGQGQARRDSIFVAQSDAAAHAQQQRASSSEAASGPQLEEVVVTAQKRQERLQDVPVAVSVISGATLTNNNQTRLDDYYNKVPSLNLAEAGNGNAPSISIRGIASGGSFPPTVALVIDEVAYGQSANPGYASTIADIDPGDVQRVEILRGPQGTLYGASSMGGLLKYVTVDPSTAGYSGRLQAGTSTITSGETGYTVRGAVNVPLASSLAARISAYDLRDPGYVDNVRNGERDVDHRDSYGVRASFLWRPVDAWSVKFGAIYQDSKRDGAHNVDSTLGGLAANQVPGTGTYNRKTEAYSALVNGKLDRVELTSVTGYNIDRVFTDTDLSALASFAQNAFGVAGASAPQPLKFDKLTQELRASVPVTDSVTWLIGGFYTDEKDVSITVIDANDPLTGARVGNLTNNNQTVHFREYAGFTDLDVTFTPAFDVQGGVRYSVDKSDYNFQSAGVSPLLEILYGTLRVRPRKNSDDKPITYLGTARYKFSSDLSAYARVATGYRPGATNAVSGIGTPPIPEGSTADKTTNYEVGLKGSVFERKLGFEAAIYYIDWKNIQLALPTLVVGNPFPVSTYYGNGGQAKSQGFEVSFDARPLKGLSLTGWVAFDDAAIKSVPAGTMALGMPGTRLPYSSRWSGSFSADQEFPLGEKLTGLLGATVSYVGDRFGIIRPTTQVRSFYPSYTQLDVHVGLSYGTWAITGFVNNASDARGILRSGLDALAPTLVTYIPPRTAGISVAKSF